MTRCCRTRLHKGVLTRCCRTPVQKYLLTSTKVLRAGRKVRILTAAWHNHHAINSKPPRVTERGQKRYMQSMYVTLSVQTEHAVCIQKVFHPYTLCGELYSMTNWDLDSQLEVCKLVSLAPAHSAADQALYQSPHGTMTKKAAAAHVPVLCHY